MMKLTLKIGGCLALLAAATSQGATVVWGSSRAQALAQARAEGKMVYLLGGRPSCNNCTYIRTVVVNATVPPMNQMIEECFVPWYCNYDNNTYEQDPYETGLAGYSLPLMCWIDPKMPLGSFMERRTGPLDDPIMLLLMRKALRKASPNALNLINNQVVGDPAYVVRGRLFTNLIAKQFFYKVNDGPWTQAVTEGPAQWQTNWSASLVGQTLRAGSGANKFYGYAVYADNSRSMTNTLTFTYAAAPPQITSNPTVVLSPVGGAAAFSVLAPNATSFTWYRQGNATPVGTGSSLQLSGLLPTDAGSYYCAVSNSSGGLLSQSAPLVLFEFMVHPEGQPGMRVYGPSGQRVTLYKVPGLQTSGWTAITNRTLTSASEHLLDYGAVGRSEGFYRLGTP